MARLVVLRGAAVVLLSCWAVAAPAQEAERDRDREREWDAQPEIDFFDPDATDRGAPSPRIAPPRPGRPDRDGRWYLGVDVEHTDRGAVITRVVRQSPADRVRLEPRDAIVTVSGYQVGYVGSRLYPLDRELELRADRRGQVLLLVQNHRNGRLVNIPVRLERADRPVEPPRYTSLIGTVSSRRIGQLPRGAVVAIRLVDITDPRAALEPVAQQVYREGGALPMSFELEYDPERIDPSRRYALQAAVTVNGIPRGLHGDDAATDRLGAGISALRRASAGAGQEPLRRWSPGP
ncbi:MAG: YbaY family lipoprotein [Pirellulaceae bacterium]|nr:YbaY family lipoprotein [Pirellulaceae bacterium]